MVEIYVDQISERLIYTLDFVFNERDLSYKLNNDYLSFQKSTSPKFVYSERHFDNLLQLMPASLLFDEAVFVYSIDRSMFEAEECLSFNRVTDPLASIFYLLSRMEEYESPKEDHHGRFAAKFSLQHEYNWLDKAMCDRWAMAFLKFLSRELSIPLEINIGSIAIRPTFDIDNVYAYKWKQGIRKMLSIAKDRVNKSQNRLLERKQVLAGEMIDPYDTYRYIESISDRGYEINMFWLLGDYAKYDKNISHKDIRHQKLICRMAEKTIVGIHPSYKSDSFQVQIKEEKERLEKILNEKIESTRQHFLKFKVRNTYSILNALGFKHEYSMGYSDQVGFRSGTARPHRWFNLNNNQVTELMIHPFVYMDGTLNEHLKLSIDESKVVIWKLHAEISRFGGELVCLWHNETIGNYGIWSGWREVLEYTLSLKNR